MKKTTGFTLIEMVIVLVLVGIITVIFSRFLITAVNSYITAKNVIDANGQALLAIERMTRDIRAVRSSSDITTATSSQITFTDSSGTSITYALSGTSLRRNSQVLADGISTLTLAYADRNGTTTATLANIRYITITLNVTQGNTNFNAKSSVYPRNLL
jgi:prepilin-type N-terminal cleavage/methylation domain-containing protein